MDYTQDTTKHTKGKHFSYGDRRELQGILSNKSVRYSLRQLARHFNCASNTMITYNKLRKLISKKLDIETTIAYN